MLLGRGEMEDTGGEGKRYKKVEKKRKKRGWKRGRERDETERELKILKTSSLSINNKL
jgi:hypothetical protein